MARFETNTKKLIEWMFGSAGYEKYDPNKMYTTGPGISRSQLNKHINNKKMKKIQLLFSDVITTDDENVNDLKLIKRYTFEEYILFELEEVKESYLDNRLFEEDSDLYQQLLKIVFESSEEPKDILYELFNEHVTINYDFAKSLNMFDVIQSTCLIPNTEIGRALIDFVGISDLSFIFYMRSYAAETYQVIYLFPVPMDYLLDVQLKLAKGSVSIA